MNSLPDNLLLQIFSSIPWRQRVKFESVSKRWYRILLDKSFQIIGRVDLDGFVKDNVLLPQAIQSLVVKKRKIINELVANNESVNNPVPLVLELIISAQPNSLTRLTVKGTHQIISSASPLIHLLLNLEVVQMEVVEMVINTCFCVDLSQLTRLKHLIGDRVHYRNCRSPCLTRLQCSYIMCDYNNINCHLRDSYQSNCRDFIQMITVAAPVIEVISLDSVYFSTSRDDEQGDVILTLPRLLTLKIYRSYFPGPIFDLKGCSNLQVININRLFRLDADFKIINLDLSVHSLVSLNTSDSVLFDQFLVSALDSPEHLYLLEELVVNEIHVFIFDRLIEIFSSFSLFSTCALRRIEVKTRHESDFLDSNCLVALVKCSSHLTLLNFDHFGIDKQCLIDLIISTVSLSNDLDIRFDRIVNGSLSDFMSDLLVALSLIDSSTICKNGVRFVVENKYCWRILWNENRLNLEYILLIVIVLLFYQWVLCNCLVM